MAHHRKPLFEQYLEALDEAPYYASRELFRVTPAVSGTTYGFLDRDQEGILRRRMVTAKNGDVIIQRKDESGQWAYHEFVPNKLFHIFYGEANRHHSGVMLSRALVRAIEMTKNVTIRSPYMPTITIPADHWLYRRETHNLQTCSPEQFEQLYMSIPCDQYGRTLEQPDDLTGEMPDFNLHPDSPVWRDFDKKLTKLFGIGEQRVSIETFDQIDEARGCRILFLDKRPIKMVQIQPEHAAEQLRIMQLADEELSPGIERFVRLWNVPTLNGSMERLDDYQIRERFVPINGNFHRTFRAIHCPDGVRLIKKGHELCLKPNTMVLLHTDGTLATMPLETFQACCIPWPSNQPMPLDAINLALFRSGRIR